MSLKKRKDKKDLRKSLKTIKNRRWALSNTLLKNKPKTYHLIRGLEVLEIEMLKGYLLQQIIQTLLNHLCLLAGQVLTSVKEIQKMFLNEILNKEMQYIFLIWQEISKMQCIIRQEWQVKIQNNYLSFGETT